MEGDESVKHCKICGELKPLSGFYRMAGMRDGHRNDCKVCNLADKRRRYMSDPAKYKAMVRRWQKANADHVNAYQRDLRARPEQKRKQRDAYYRRTFGISADDFDALLEAQGGVCAICACAPEREASFHLDHDHVTGDIRGVLCLSCNQGVGQFQDDPELLERAAAYVRGGRATDAG
jgi:hypothetical protein